jgi:hypothetical protein
MQNICNYVSEQTVFFDIKSCNYSVVTIFDTCKVTLYAERFALLHQYFPKYICSAQYGCFL